MISIELDDRAVRAALAQLRDHAQDLAPAFREIGSSLVDEIKLGFVDSRDPWGIPWKRLKYRIGQPLLDTGKLRNSITFRLIGRTGVRIGTADYLPKAALHQFGSSKSSGPGSGVAARPFLPARGGAVDLPEDWRQQVLDILRTHLQPK
jgi:phage gpG-like protein